MLHIVKRVIDEELQMRDHAQLGPDLLAEAETDVLGVLPNGFDHHILIRGHIDAQIRSRNGEI